MLGELRTVVLLEEVAAAGDGGVRLALRARDVPWNQRSPPRVIGSPSENSVRNGLSQAG